MSLFVIIRLHLATGKLCVSGIPFLNDEGVCPLLANNDHIACIVCMKII